MPLPDGRPTASELSNGVSSAEASASPYSLHPQVVQRARETVAGLSRRALRRRLAHEAQVTYLAMMDPHAGSTNRDRLDAANGAARVSGLVKDGTASRVSLVVTFKGLRRSVVDADAIEARVVEAAGLPPLAGRDGPSGSIGAAGRVEGGGGEGG